MSISPHTSQRLMEKFVQTIQQQPKPVPLKRPHASFLEDSVDPLPSSPAPKRYRPEFVDSFVTQWVESASGSESYRERHCRSDTLLGHSHGDLISRRLIKSAPNMGYRRDADEFAMPPIPASTRSCSHRADAEDEAWVPSYGGSAAPSVTDSNPDSGRSSGRSLVENPSYRRLNLTANHIYLRDVDEELPEHIAKLVHTFGQDRNSPGPSSDQLRHDADLHQLEKGAGEPEVEDYFKANISPRPGPSGSLKRIDRLPMSKHVVPNVQSKLKVSTPVPDMLFGYTDEAFPQQQTQLISMRIEMVANSQGLMYPFFIIEFKADGPSGAGSLWVATNQCLGGSASCVNIAERLNCQLRRCKSDQVRPIDSTAFSVAMSGTEARLYVSWKHDELKYYMAKVDSFLLQKPKDYVEFRKYVRNIIDWGKDRRLKEIRDSLDSLLEESRKTASQLAKSRPPPSDDSASSSSHKRKDSSSRGRNSRAKSVQEYPSGANAPPSASLQEYNQFDSSLQIAAADSVYAPPSASLLANNECSL